MISVYLLNGCAYSLNRLLLTDYGTRELVQHRRGLAYCQLWIDKHPNVVSGAITPPPTAYVESLLPPQLEPNR